MAGTRSAAAVLLLLVCAAAAATPATTAAAAGAGKRKGKVGSGRGGAGPPQPPPCQDMATRGDCEARAGCRWCRSDALDDMCFGTTEAWRLPSQVFSCDPPSGAGVGAGAAHAR